MQRPRPLAKGSGFILVWESLTGILSSPPQILRFPRVPLEWPWLTCSHEPWSKVGVPSRVFRILLFEKIFRPGNTYGWVGHR
jgi:hypothetical protein